MGGTAGMAQFRKGDHSDLVDALDTIDPATLNESEWRNLCAGWKASGLNYATFDAWCLRDPARYDERENRKRWDSFKPEGNANGAVGAGTVARIIEAHGGSIPRYGRRTTDSEPTTKTTGDRATTPADVPPTDPCEQLSLAVRRLFRPGDMVNVITDATPKANAPGKFNPTGHGRFYEAEALTDALDAHRGEGDAGLEAVIGPYNHEAGVWWRVNPTDGRGTSDANVTRCDHVLLEADEGSVPDQLAVIDSLGLPLAYCAFSGNHSVHAIVNIGTGTDVELYEERVTTLYAVAQAHGFVVDGSCASRSKLSRLPGAMRIGREQRLLRAGGGGTWAGWRGRLRGLIGGAVTTAPKETGLPHAVDLTSEWGKPTRRPPCLIGDEGRGLLRRGHFAVLSGPSKMGKSWALLELCVAVATGTSWMGFSCAQGRALYVNFELDKDSVRPRLEDVARACAGGDDREAFGMGVARNVRVVNLRGKVASTDTYTEHIIQEARAFGDVACVIVDPLYMYSDAASENDAAETKRVMADLLRITTETGAAVVTAHHFAKGLSGGKQAMDRAAGSGVFARAPDAVISMSPLEPPEGEADALGDATAWRLEAVLREFPPMKPFDVLYKFPRHYVESTGSCSTWQVTGADPYASGRRAKKRREAEERSARGELMREAFGRCVADHETEEVNGTFGATAAAMWERMGKDPASGRRPTKRSISNWADEEWCPIERVDVSDSGKPRYLFRLAGADDGDEE